MVILLLGITAVLVLPALTPPSTQSADAASALLTRARRAAIRRGESLRLRVAADGAWALVSARDGAEIESGRLPKARRAQLGGEEERPVAGNAEPELDVTIDALGSCRPASHALATTGFDPLACAWLPSSADRVAVNGAQGAR